MTRIILLVLLLTIAPRVLFAATTPLRISDGFPVPNSAAGTSFGAVTSPDGRYIAFVSTAPDLVTNRVKWPGVLDLYLYNVTNGTVSLISAGLDGRGGSGPSYGAQFSRDSRYLVFTSEAGNLIPDDSNEAADIYRFDLVSKHLQPVSTPLTANSRESVRPTISGDGRWIGFEERNGDASSIRLRDMSAEFPITVTTRTNRSNSVSAPVLSGDGRYLFFVESFSDRVATNQIMRWDSSTLEFASVSQPAYTRFPEAKTTHQLVVSSNGSRVAYSVATFSSVFVVSHDLVANTISVISSNGPSSSVQSERLSMSHDGRYVATRGKVFDAVTNGVSFSIPNSSHSRLSSDGQYLASLQNLNNRLQLVRIELATGNSNLLSTSIAQVQPEITGFSMSDDAATFALEIHDSSLVPEDFNGALDVFIRRVTDSEPQLVSARRPGVPGTIPGASILQGAFAIDHSTLIPFITSTPVSIDDTNITFDVVVRNLSTGTNLIVSLNTNGVPGNGSSGSPRISANGRYVVFVSSASDLVANDSNRVANVFLRDLELGVTTMAGAGVPMPAFRFPSWSPSISADGRWIAYYGRGPSHSTFSSAFLFDRLIGTNSQMNTSAFGTPFELRFGPVEITSDGRYVLFERANLGGTIRYDVSTGTTNNLSFGTRFFGLNAARTHHLTTVGATTQLRSENPSTGERITSTNAPGGMRSVLQLDAAGHHVLARANLDDVILHVLTNGATYVVFDGSLSNRAGTPALSGDSRFVGFNRLQVDPFFTNQVGSHLVIDLATGITNEIDSRFTAGSSFQPGSRSMTYVAVDGQGDSGQPNVYLVSLDTGDSDADGLEDSWEKFYFGNLGFNGTDNPDRDHANNFGELRAGTNPADATSRFSATIKPLTSPTNNVAVVWPVLFGRAYQVETREAFGPNTSWSPLTHAPELQGNLMSLTQTNHGATNQFYRVVVE